MQEQEDGTYMLDSKTLRAVGWSVRLSDSNVLIESFFLPHEFFLLFSGSFDLFHAMDLCLRILKTQVCVGVQGD